MPLPTKPAAYVPIAAPGYTLDAADHDDGLHETDRTAIRGIIDSLGARRNLLINGGFRIAQKSVAGVITPVPTDNQYGLDRWRLLLEAANAAVVAQDVSDVPSDGGSASCRLTVGAGEDNKFGIWQVLEYNDVKHLRGKTVSLQAKLKATAAIADVRMAVVEWTSTADSVAADPISSWGAAGTPPTLATNYAYLAAAANLNVTTSWVTYRVEGLTVGASANNLAVFIWCEDETTTVTTDILRIADVQLEEGPVCTELERRPIQQELALCLRYFWRHNSIGNVLIMSWCGFSSTTLARFTLYFPVPMRTAPGLTMSGASDLQVTTDFTNTSTGTIGVSTAGVYYAALSISSLTPTAFVVGNMGFVRWVGTTSYMDWLAEL